MTPNRVTIFAWTPWIKNATDNIHIRQETRTKLVTKWFGNAWLTTKHRKLSIKPQSPATLSSSIQVTGFLFKSYCISLQNPFIPSWSLSKSLPCLLLHPGLTSFFITSRQWWFYCYLYKGLLCLAFQPGLWENGMLYKCVFGKSSTIIQHNLWRREYPAQ